MKEKLIYIWLSNLQFLTYEEISNIFTLYNDDIEKMYEDASIIFNEINLSTKKKDLYAASKNKNNLDRQLKYIEENSIEVITINEHKYPSVLRNIYDPPYTIYCRGNTNLLNNKCGVAIVGARKCSEYGRNVVNYIINELCNYNIPIISGMAKGVDGEAHRLCIRYNKPTIAVLGCGIDIIYPKENTDIAYSIINHGCMITEFPVGTKPFSFNFPKRNRIISGLSSDVVVIEARHKSGSLITANIAIEQGKNVYAVPGSIFNDESRGCNELIQQGAFALYDVDVIFSVSTEIGDYIKIKNKTCSESKESSDNIESPNLIIFKWLNYPKDIYQLSKDTHIDVIKLNKILGELEIDGLIERDYMNKYHRTCGVK